MRAVTIRRADQYDDDWIIEQMRLFDSYHGTSRRLFADEEGSRARLLTLIEHHVAFVAERDDKPAGFIIGTLGPHPFNPEIRCLYEAFWWVIPEHRISRAARSLLDAFISWGRENADWIIVSSLTQSMLNDRTLETLGFKIHERSFLLEVH